MGSVSSGMRIGRLPPTFSFVLLSFQRTAVRVFGHLPLRCGHSLWRLARTGLLCLRDLGRLSHRREAVSVTNCTARM